VLPVRRIPTVLRPGFDGFRRVVEHVERAKTALTDAVPTTRLPGRPLADALLEFEEELAAARSEMASWRLDELEDVWAACAAAITEARDGAERLRLVDAPPVGFEGLIGTIGDLLARLDAFAAAAERFRELGRRRSLR
jgi:hypothetical protein